jgi:hypothetical protein
MKINRPLIGGFFGSGVAGRGVSAFFGTGVGVFAFEGIGVGVFALVCTEVDVSDLVCTEVGVLLRIGSGVSTFSIG